MSCWLDISLARSNAFWACVSSASCASRCASILASEAFADLTAFSWSSESISATVSPASTSWPSVTFMLLTMPDTWAPTLTSELASSVPEASTVSSMSARLTATVVGAFTVSVLLVNHHAPPPAARSATSATPSSRVVRLRLRFGTAAVCGVTVGGTVGRAVSARDIRLVVFSLAV